MTTILTVWSSEDDGPRTGLKMERKNFRIRPKVVKFLDIGPWLSIGDLEHIIQHLSAKNPDYVVELSDDWRSVIGTRRDVA